MTRLIDIALLCNISHSVSLLSAGRSKSIWINPYIRVFNLLWGWKEHLLFLQRTWIQFSAPSRWLAPSLLFSTHCCVCVSVYMSHSCRTQYSLMGKSLKTAYWYIWVELAICKSTLAGWQLNKVLLQIRKGAVWVVENSQLLGLQACISTARGLLSPVIALNKCCHLLCAFSSQD